MLVGRMRMVRPWFLGTKRLPVRAVQIRKSRIGARQRQCCFREGLKTCFRPIGSLMAATETGEPDSAIAAAVKRK